MLSWYLKRWKIKLGQNDVQQPSVNISVNSSGNYCTKQMTIRDVYLFSLLTGTANKTDSRGCDAVISKELEGGKCKHPRKGE